MKKWIAAFLLCLLTACSAQNNTIGNGKLDPVEAAALKVGIGVALNAKPELIAPVKVVSGALLVALNGSVSASLTDVIDLVIAAEVEKLNLDPLTKASFMEFVALAKANIQTTISTEKIEASNTYIVVYEFIKLINESATLRS